ncbi:MAG: diadenylate cyclase CdaA [Phycisphaerales bacterium]
MTVVDRIQGLASRLTTYPWWQVAVEFAVIWIVVYLIVRFVQGTRAAGALKGLLVILVVLTILSRVLGGAVTFQRLGLLYDRFLGFVAIALIVIFQPELRRALVRLGETSFLRSTPKDITYIVGEVADAARYLSRSRFGALIAMERQTKLGGLVEGGTRMNAELSSSLIQTIFFPGSALHDLACVVSGRVILAAGVQLPLADPTDMPDPSLGSRHRAAVGLSQECDAIVVVVSEETGGIRIAERGKLTEPLSDQQLRGELQARLTRSLLHREGAPAEPGAGAGGALAEPVPAEGSAGDSVAGEAALSDTGLAEGGVGDSSRLGDTMVNDAMGGSMAGDVGGGVGEGRARGAKA